MSGTQLLRIVVFLLVPVASGAVAFAGKRRRSAMSGWRGDAIAYGPVVGASFALLAFIAVSAASVLAGT